MILEKFKNYIKHAKHKDGTYVSMLMSDKCKKQLEKFVKSNLKLNEYVDKSEYHCTIIYSRTPVPEAEDVSYPEIIHARCYGYEVFPTKDGNKCLVMRLNCSQVNDVNSKLTQLGATSDYSSYKPHVTVCYDYKSNDDVSTLPIPDFDLVFDKIEVKPLDTNYTMKNS